MSTSSEYLAAEFPAVTNEAGICTVGTQDNFELDIYNAPYYRDLISDTLADAACSSVVLDLGQVNFLDATILGVIVGGQRKARAQNKLLVVDVVDNPRIRKTFTISGLDRALLMVGTRPE